MRRERRARLDPGRVKSGMMPVVFDPRVGSSLVGHLLGAIAGSAIARRASFLLDKDGAQIFDSGVTITDDPLRRRGLRSRPFDGEACPPLRASWSMPGASPAG
jgi:PmbA protein